MMRIEISCKIGTFFLAGKTRFRLFRILCTLLLNTSKALAVFGIAAACSAQEQTNAGELAKQFANPISSLISVPLQNATDYGIGENNGSRNTLNFQPVVPIRLSEKLNLITRYIIPVISQYNITGNGSKQSGLADGVFSGFFSPAAVKNGFTWGAGPVFLVPLATNDLLGAKKWGTGPTAVALRQINGWTYGVLANQIWSVSSTDDGEAKVNQCYFQPFLAFNFSSGASIGGNNEITFNWQANTTTAFLHMYVNGITKIGKQTILVGGGPRICYAAPDAARPDFGLRFLVVFLFPK